MYISDSVSQFSCVLDIIESESFYLNRTNLIFILFLFLFNYSTSIRGVSTIRTVINSYVQISWVDVKCLKWKMLLQMCTKKWKYNYPVCFNRTKRE